MLPWVGGNSPTISLNSVLLPAPFGSDQAMHLARLDRQIDIGDRRQSAEPLGDAFDFDERHDQASSSLS